MGRKLLKVPLGRDNAHRLLLTDDGEPVNLASVTRYVLQLTPELAIDSHVELAAFDATAGGGVLELTLGTLDAPPPAGDYAAVQLITYDPSNPNGIVWDDELHFRFAP